MAVISEDLRGDGIFGDFMAPTASVFELAESIGYDVATEFVDENAGEVGEWIGVSGAMILMFVFYPILLLLVVLGAGNVILNFLDGNW